LGFGIAACPGATASIEYRYKGYMSGIPAFWNDSSKSGLGQGFRIEERNFIGLIFSLRVMAECSATRTPQLGTRNPNLATRNTQHEILKPENG
jgi:hypothetical protein